MRMRVQPNLLEAIREGKLDLLINIPVCKRTDRGRRQRQTEHCRAARTGTWGETQLSKVHVHVC